MVGMTVEQAREAAKMGAYLEFTGNSMIGIQKFVSFEEAAKQMRAVGLERVVLSSDFGQAGNPLHPDGWQQLYDGFRKAGISEAEWTMIAKRNPAKAIGME
jgi:microsomal dipeptidase-like Zn-dependent dipeptidase